MYMKYGMYKWEMQVCQLENSCGLSCLFLHIPIIHSYVTACVNNIIMILILIIYSMCDFNYNYIFYCMTRQVKITANTVYNNNTATRYLFFLTLNLSNCNFLGAFLRGRQRAELCVYRILLIIVLKILIRIIMYKIWWCEPI